LRLRDWQRQPTTTSSLARFEPKAIYQVQAMTMRATLIVALMLAPTFLHADMLKCKIDGYKEDIFITTSPDTNSNDGQYARIGISPGTGNRAMVVADRMGATAFVELNVDGTPVGLVTVQKDMRVIKSRHTIDPSGAVFAPSQNAGVCTRCVGVTACPP
jgi:hypothetical protein